MGAVLAAAALAADKTDTVPIWVALISAGFGFLGLFATSWMATSAQRKAKSVMRELTPNGGSSLADAIRRIDRRTSKASMRSQIRFARIEGALGLAPIPFDDEDLLDDDRVNDPTTNT